MKRKRRRRGGKSGGSQAEPQPAPLQPVYPEANGNVADDQEDTPATAEIHAESEAATPQEPAQRSRRKRRRGGKGRKQQGGAPQQTPAATEAEPAEAALEPGDEAEPEAASEGAAQPRPVQQPAQKRQPRGTVVLTIGLPGSGKTSWFRRRAITPLSSDLLRMMLFDDIGEQRYQDLVFSTLRYLLRARLIARMPWNYVDATNLSPRERRGWIKMAQEFGYDVHAVFFDVPVDVCMDRNQRRGRIVPEDVMQRMAQKLRPPTFEEGFSKITIVRVKKQAAPETQPDNEIQRVEEPETSDEPEIGGGTSDFPEEY